MESFWLSLLNWIASGHLFMHSSHEIPPQHVNQVEDVFWAIATPWQWSQQCGHCHCHSSFDQAIRQMTSHWTLKYSGIYTEFMDDSRWQQGDMSCGCKTSLISPPTPCLTFDLCLYAVFGFVQSQCGPLQLNTSHFGVIRSKHIPPELLWFVQAQLCKLS